MTLKQIDARLTLFKEYLQYLVEFRILQKSYIKDRSITVGVLSLGPNNLDNPVGFEQWLYVNDHEDLINFIVHLKVNDENYWYDMRPAFISNLEYTQQVGKTYPFK